LTCVDFLLGDFPCLSSAASSLGVVADSAHTNGILVKMLNRRSAGLSVLVQNYSPFV
jgi:hypothetical protein